MAQSLPTERDQLAILYEQDYYCWLETTVHLLQTGQLSALDIANLQEEIADVGRNEKRAIYSNLKVLLLHLLKLNYQPERRSQSWIATIVEHRQRLRKALKESPSLQPYLIGSLPECYQDTRALAAAETGLPIDEFPIELPFQLK